MQQIVRLFPAGDTRVAAEHLSREPMQSILRPLDQFVFRLWITLSEAVENPLQILARIAHGHPSIGPNSAVVRLALRQEHVMVEYFPRGCSARSVSDEVASGKQQTEAGGTSSKSTF
ncbi:MAG: hypothetical protein WCL32_07305 [Planctomycetota bacterium]